MLSLWMDRKNMQFIKQSKKSEGMKKNSIQQRQIGKTKGGYR